MRSRKREKKEMEKHGRSRKKGIQKNRDRDKKITKE